MQLEKRDLVRNRNDFSIFIREDTLMDWNAGLVVDFMPVS